MTTETTQLFQKAAFSPQSHFVLLRGRELEISRQQRRGRQIYKVDLLALRTPSERRVSIAWKWWLASLMSFVMTVALVLSLSHLQLDSYALLTGFLGVIVSVVLSILSWKKGSRKQVFYSRHSGVPLVSLYLGKPNKAEFQKFILHLESSIESLQKEFNLTRDQELAGELRTLRRLNEGGVVSLEDYEESKEVLFQKH